MAQIHALTPEGRLPSQAVAHVREIVTDTTWQVDIPLTADWRTDVGSDVTAYRTGNVVTVVAWRLSAAAGITGVTTAYTLPPGYRPPPTLRNETRTVNGRPAILTSQSRVQVTDPTSSVDHHSFTFVTLDPVPSD